MQNWITIMTFTYPHEAYAIRGALESAGIQTFLKDELTIQVDNFLSNAMGGIRLQVPKDQFSHAKEILKSNGYFDDKGEFIVNSDEVKIVQKKDSYKSVCPFCSSNHIGKKKRPTIVSVISILLFYLPLPVFKRNYYCFDCKSEWKYMK